MHFPWLLKDFLSIPRNWLRPDSESLIYHRYFKLLIESRIRKISLKSDNLFVWFTNLSIYFMFIESENWNQWLEQKVGQSCFKKEIL